jgi:hypothetical protein
MKRRLLSVGLLVAATALLTATLASAGQGEWGRVRAANSQYRDPAAAMAAEYTLIEGLDHCFDNPGVGGMGIHYIRAESLDLVVDPLQPEAMVYTPQANGRMKLGAVEYIVPAAAWDAAGNTEPPKVLDQTFHLNEALGVYVLHAWLWNGNPSGTFQDWNPHVSCSHGGNH